MASAQDGQILAIKFACLCQQIRGHVNIPRSLLPLSAFVCHCSTCRHTSGLLCTTLCEVPFPSSSLEVEGETCNYELDGGWRITFCTQCGASIYRSHNESKNIKLYTGALEIDNADIEFDRQCCANETKDGGLSEWLNLPIADKADHCDSRVNANFADDSKVQKDSERASDVTASCHCGGVQFIITPPSEASFQLSSPYPDLIVPFHSGSASNEEDTKWWLRANGTKYFAGTCACNSCRLASGSNVQTWAFIPKIKMRKVNGELLDFRMGTLKQYGSSEGVYRNFCGVCGATVFWHNDGRPYLIDVSAGLLNARTGARAEKLLQWATNRVSFEEDAQNKTFIALLGEGLRKWGSKQQ